MNRRQGFAARCGWGIAVDEDWVEVRCKLGVERNEVVGPTDSVHPRHQQVVAFLEVGPQPIDGFRGDRAIWIVELDDRDVVDRREVALSLGLPQWEGVQQLAAKVASVLSERGRRELHHGFAREVVSDGAPGTRSAVVGLVDLEVAELPDESRAGLGGRGTQRVRSRHDDVAGVSEFLGGRNCPEAMPYLANDRPERIMRDNAELL
jgi:hypothetical protein